MKILPAIVLLLVLTACGTPTNATPSGGAGIALPSEPATIIGQITSLENGTMLVEEDPGQPTSGRKIAFRLQDTTVVGERSGTDVVARTAADLKVAQRVAVWADGALAESFPEQGTALAVVISLAGPSE